MEWITVKTKQGQIGQVQIDPNRPIADQITDQAIWWGRNLPDASHSHSHAGPVFFFLIVFVMVAAAAILGAL